MARLQAADPTASYASLSLTQYDGPNEDCDWNNNDFVGGAFRALAPVATAPGGSVPWFVAEALVPDYFSEFYLAAGPAPLPVELTAFTAEGQGDAVRLRWRTASEKNAARFEVERNADGQRFERIGTVAAQGSTASPTDYAFTAPTLPSSSAHTLYFRLKQVDADGRASYSPVRAVVRATAAGFSLFPTVAEGSAVHYAYSGAPATALTVHNALGQTVRTLVAQPTGVLPVAGLASGWYVVRLWAAGGPQQARLYVP